MVQTWIGDASNVLCSREKIGGSSSALSTQYSTMITSRNKTHQVSTTATHVGTKLDTSVLACIHLQNLKHRDWGMGHLHMHAHTLQRNRSVTYICKHFCMSTCSHNKLPLMYIEADTCIHACMHECMHVHDIQVTQYAHTHKMHSIFCLKPKKL